MIDMAVRSTFSEHTDSQNTYQGKKMKNTIILLAVTSVLMNYSFSEIIKVPQDYSSIQTAIDSCSSRDTILVSKGLYYNVIIIDKPLTLIGIDKDSVILYSQITIKASDVTLQNIKIDMGIADDLFNGNLTCILIDSSSNVRIENLYLKGADGDNLVFIYDGYWSMEIDSSKDISILSVSMVGGNGAGGDGSFNHYHANGSGGNGINITRSENINMDSCSISGGHGGIPSDPRVGGQGANGNSIVLRDSSVASVINSNLVYGASKDSSSTLSLINTTVSTTSVLRQQNSISNRFILLQNHPNPFNPSTTISFTLPIRSYVSLKVYDILGKEITVIANEEMGAGSHSIQWNATNVSSGVYFCRMQAGTYSETKRLLLLR
jgi:hypothetical protein